jgi:amino acid permease
MDNISFLDVLPVWVFFAVVLLIVLASVEGGYRLGKYRYGRDKEEKDAPISEMVGALLGLLALILAFTFGFGAQRFDVRRQRVLDEANAIGTTNLRAEMLPERREEIRTLLKQYVDVRLKMANDVAEGVRRSENIQNQLWAQAVVMGEKYPNSIVVGLFIQSLNQVIDLHAERVQVGLRNRVPRAIWLVLVTIAVVSLAAMGYHAGLAGTRRSLAVLAVAFGFSAVIGLIADLDRSQQGLLNVGQHALIDLQRSMNAPAPGGG